MVKVIPKQWDKRLRDKYPEYLQSPIDIPNTSLLGFVQSSVEKLMILHHEIDEKARRKEARKSRRESKKRKSQQRKKVKQR